MFGLFSKPALPEPGAALPGRAGPIDPGRTHHVSGRPLNGPFPDGTQHILFGMGCFWGAERLFWSLPGVIVTSVGYAGGQTPNPTYREVCSGGTGHTEIVRVTYDPAVITAHELLRVFWEGHNPTQGMRQGNDTGTQYRSAVYAASPEQKQAALETRDAFQARLTEQGHGAITTEIADAPAYYFAEEYHQQYLAKNPGGYCGLGGTGVSCPVGAVA